MRARSDRTRWASFHSVALIPLTSEQVRELGTGMPDEAGYIGHLVAYELADQLLKPGEKLILTAARNEWLRSIEIGEQIREMEARQREQEQQYNSNNDGERE